MNRWEAEGMAPHLWAVEGIEAKKQTSVSEGNTQRVPGAAGAAAEVHLQQVGVWFLPEAGLLGSGGCGLALFLPRIPAFNNRCSCFSALWIPLHLLKTGEQPLSLTFLEPLILELAGFSLACGSQRQGADRRGSQLPSDRNRIFGQHKASWNSFQHAAPHGSSPSEFLLAAHPGGLLANLFSCKVYNIPVSFLFALVEKYVSLFTIELSRSSLTSSPTPYPSLSSLLLLWGFGGSFLFVYSCLEFPLPAHALFKVQLPGLPCPGNSHDHPF